MGKNEEAVIGWRGSDGA